ncbi:MAG: hypothetical protein ACK5ME_04510 [Parahaliea sp.]
MTKIIQNHRKALPLAGLLLLITVGTQAQTSPETQACQSYDQTALANLQLMQAKAARLLDASADGKTPPQLTPGEHYLLQLQPQAEVNFSVEPGRTTLADGAAAGSVRFTTTKGGKYRINISDGSWVDIADPEGNLVQSLKFHGDRNCQPLRKYVEYTLSADTAYTLQFSGGAQQALHLAITAPE